jgi:plastocyanin
MLVACVLCVLGVLAAVAIAAPGQGAHHRFTHTAKACRHARHGHCRARRARGQGHRKHKRRVTSKHAAHTHRSAPTHGSLSTGSSATGGSSAPGTTGTAPTTPGATPGSGAPSPGSGGGGPPAKSPGSPAAPARVQVTAEDTEGFRFVLSRTSVPAGKVIIEFVNHGQDEHNLHAVESTAGAEAGSLPNTAPGAHPQLTLDLRPGSYTLFCSLPEHEAKGMKATLVVQ